VPGCYSKQFAKAVSIEIFNQSHLNSRKTQVFSLSHLTSVEDWRWKAKGAREPGGSLYAREYGCSIQAILKILKSCGHKVKWISQKELLWRLCAAWGPFHLDREFSYKGLLEALVVEGIHFVIRLNMGSREGASPSPYKILRRVREGSSPLINPLYWRLCLMRKWNIAISGTRGRWGWIKRPVASWFEGAPFGLSDRLSRRLLPLQFVPKKSSYIEIPGRDNRSSWPGVSFFSTKATWINENVGFFIKSLDFGWKLLQEESSCSRRRRHDKKETFGWWQTLKREKGLDIYPFD
jgi:hypothetical protein